ncbi:MAG: hypothetical protein GF398_00275 [Chitinivibrionales bacterium]|nr:hypothetical protein [Chitinivibrionales bacterium]
MKAQRNALLTAFITALSVTAGFAQSKYAYDHPVELKSRSLSGPRMGMTAVLPTGGEMEKRLKDENMHNLISQFGWHFEWVIEPAVGGPAFVIEAIPFFGGVEYGMVIPTTSLVFGIRLPQGWEFGMGPMATYTGEEPNYVSSALVLAFGKSLDFNGVSIPLNLALATNTEGQRLSFVFGYAIANRSRR